MQCSRYDSEDQAALQSRLHGWRQRVLVYVTRSGEELELLSFRHLPDDSGAQLPAGGLEPGETPEAAAIREVREETGLSLAAAHPLGACRWDDGRRTQVWYYFAAQAPAGTPDAWTHQVTGGEETGRGGDLGLTFALRFTPLHDPDLTPGLGAHEYLPDLLRHLRLSAPQEQP